jgi:ankyrin repeat protein
MKGIKMMKQILLIATITMGLALQGCGKSDEDSSPDGGAETPQAPNIPIHEAAEKGDLETIKKHIAAKTDINSQDGKDGETPLHRAITRGQTEVAKLLIGSGADVNLGRKRDGKTPLALAMEFGQERDEIAQLLKAKGAK